MSKPHFVQCFNPKELYFELSHMSKYFLEGAKNTNKKHKKKKKDIFCISRRMLQNWVVEKFKKNKQKHMCRAHTRGG